MKRIKAARLFICLIFLILFLVEMSKSISDYLASIFDVAIAGAFPDLPLVNSPIIPIQPKQEKFGDYQCNAAMPIAGLFKGLNLF